MYNTEVMGNKYIGKVKLLFEIYKKIQNLNLRYGIDRACGLVQQKDVWFLQQQLSQQHLGSLTAAQVTEIAKTKLPDLNVNSLEAAESQVRGTCRSMGITVVD